MRVALAEDSTLFRQGLKMLLTSAGVDVVFDSPDGDSFLVELENHAIDLALLDLRMPPSHSDEGLRVALQVMTQRPRVAVVILSTFIRPDALHKLMEATTGGGRGYILKDRVDDVASLIDCLSRACEGQFVVDPELVSSLFDRKKTEGLVATLTDREREVLKLIAEGYSNAGIAEKLEVSVRTAENTAARIFAKLSLPDSDRKNRRVHAVLAWLRASKPLD